MKKATIAIDIDDVLADNAAGFVAFSNQRWGVTLTVDDYDEHWSMVWKTELEETLARRDEFLESGAQNHYTHAERAIEVLRHLSVDYDLRIVTSRMLRTRDDTLAWIHKHYEGIFQDEMIHFAGIWDNPDVQAHLQTKADVVKGIGAHYLIDDRLKHCVAASKQGIQALLFGNYSWNQTDHIPKNVTGSRLGRGSEVF